MRTFDFRTPVRFTIGRIAFWVAALPSGKRPPEKEDLGGEANARLEAAAWNAFVRAARTMNRDPVELAEEWQDRLADAIGREPVCPPTLDL
jgi:hypothetical protein